MKKDKEVALFAAEKLKSNGRQSGKKMVMDALAAVTAGLQSWLGENSKHGFGQGRVDRAVAPMETLGAEKAAYIGLRAALHMVFEAHHDRTTCSVRRVCQEIGEKIWEELIYTDLSEKDPKALKRIFRKKLGRQRIIEAVRQARMYGVDAGDLAWTKRHQVYVGSPILNAILEQSGRFELVEKEPVVFSAAKGRPDVGQRQIGLTETAQRELEAGDVEFAKPYHIPATEPPRPWTAVRMGRTPLIVNARQEQIEQVDQMLQDKEALLAVATVNILQAVPFRINAPILGLVEWAITNRISIKGLPRETDRGAICLAHQDLQIAKTLRDAARFYIPLHLDFRGRIVPLPNFNYQRGDQIRALFLFAEGYPLGPGGLRELAIHVANTGDFGKISKTPFENRVCWTYQHRDLIERVARDPQGNLEDWVEADEPFQFVVACREWVAAGGDPGYVSHLPIGKDGTCSGLQHYSAICRSEPEAKLVNLVPSDWPQDIYQVVADHVNQAITDDPSPEAALWRAHGVDRKTVKRSVMTYLYGSREYGFAEHLHEDEIKPLFRQIEDGIRSEHPLEIDGDKGQKCRTYLAKRIMAGIKDTMGATTRAMAWLQNLASALAKKGRPVSWVAPSGLPVLNAYPKVDKDHRIYVWICNEKLTLRIYEEVLDTFDSRKQASALCPNLIHSMDASHLALTIQKASVAGINSFLTIHDSFATHAGKLGLLSRVLREAFVEMYEAHDPLQALFDAAGARVKSPPERGSLDLTKVLESPYFFS